MVQETLGDPGSIAAAGRAERDAQSMLENRWKEQDKSAPPMLNSAVSKAIATGLQKAKENLMLQTAHQPQGGMIMG